MTNQEILAYARKGILSDRRFCAEMRDKALEASKTYEAVDKTYSEAIRKLADAFQHDIDALETKLKELECVSSKE